MLKTKIVKALKDALPDEKGLAEGIEHAADAIIEIILQSLIDAAVKLGDKEENVQ